MINKQAKITTTTMATTTTTKKNVDVDNMFEDDITLTNQINSLV